MEKSPEISSNHLLALAISAGKEEIFTLLEHVSADMIKSLLKNPMLDENHLLSLLRGKRLSSDIISTICKHDAPAKNYQVNFELACHPDTPPHFALGLLSKLYLFDLLKLCTLPKTAPDIKVAAERLLIQRMPTEPLGSKLTLARRGTAAIAEALLREGQPEVVAVCLDNPRLKEGAVHQFLTSGRSNADTISQIARHSRWHQLANIKLAILKNPRTPQIWFTLWLPSMPQRLVKELASSSRLTTQQRQLITSLLGKRHS